MFRHLFRPEYTDVLRQELIQCCLQFFRVKLSLCVEISRLSKRMNTGIRSSCPVNFYRFFQKS